VRVGLLGPLQLVAEDGTEKPVPTAPKERALLSLLALRTGSTVLVGEIVSALWGDRSPASAVKVIQHYVSSLRRVVPSELIDTVGGGYRLNLPPTSVDVFVFESLIQQGSKAVDRGDYRVGAEELVEALGHWRGEPLVELADQAVGMAEIVRLSELHRSGEESLFDARLALGEHAAMIGDLEAAVRADPLRERRWAQLMLALYRTGRQADALRAYRRLTTVLGEELGIGPSRDLRDLEEAILLQKSQLDLPPAQQDADGRRSQESRPSPPIAREPAPDDGLPVEMTELIGRDDLVAAISALVERERLVTLWGPGGVGKTRVAVRLARSTAGLYPDGVYFIDLATAERPPAVADLLLGGLRAQPEQDEAPADTATRVLRSARALLVLDNCEHLLDDARAVVALIGESCPDIRVVTTSRESLSIPGERLVQIPPLGLPDETVLSAAQAASAAVELFIARASNVDPTFVLNDDNVSDVLALCRIVDGLPFAIELAAGRLDVESVADLVADIESATLLTRIEGRRPVSARTASVEASLSWSYELLSPPEQDLFRSLSMFSGAITREMALTYCGDDNRVAGRGLDRLIRASLISRDLAVPSRWRMLEPAKQFGRARIPPEDLDRLRRTHAGLMLARAEKFAPQIRTSEQVHACEVFRAELPDHRVAMAYFLDPDQQPSAVESAARLVVALFSFCQFQVLAEATRWATVIAERLSDDSALLPEVCGAAALGAWFEGRLDAAIGLGERAVELSEAANRKVPFWARLALVDAYGFLGQADGLITNFEALVRDSRADPDPFWQINGLGYASIGMVLTGRVERAASLAEEALREARVLGNPECLQWALHAMGRALAVTDPNLASEIFQEAMSVASAVDSRLARSINLSEWVSTKRRSSAISDAAAGLVELSRLLRATGIRPLVANALLESAFVLYEAGDIEMAALAFLTHARLPGMPGSDDPVLDALGRNLRTAVGMRWKRLELEAATRSEQEILGMCVRSLEPISLRTRN
jgi:DNA-binding SARP family transcriptional activator/tetratricopeptide (TPR) repeat protein